MAGSEPISAGSAQAPVLPIANRLWDTRDVRPNEAFDYYREGICAAFMDLVPELEASGREQFRAKVQSTPIAGWALNRVAASSHQVLRTRREIEAAPGECFYLNLQAGGACEIGQSGTTITLRPADVGIFDSTQPFALEHRSRPTLAVASFWVPRRAVLDRLPKGFAPKPTILSRHETLGRLIRETARSLADGIDWMPTETADRLFGFLLDLTAIVLSDSAPVRIAPARREGLFSVIRAHVERRLTDPALSAGACAAALGISERYVQKLFAEHGTTFAEHVGEQRLALAAAMLREPANAHLPIATIAYDAGFGDLSHFGRTFKKRFACTPGEWRRQSD